MCIVGGFLGSYALLLRGNFGSAQTANLILLFVNIEKGSFGEVGLRICALIIYIAVLSITYVIVKKYGRKARQVSIVIEAVGILLIGFLPSNMNDIVALLPVFALAACQWGNFNGTKKYNSPTLFSTGNVRQCIDAWTEYGLERNRIIKMKALFYSKTLLFYHFGVLFGIYFVMMFQEKSVWMCLLPLTGAFILVTMLQREGKALKKYIIENKSKTINN